MPKEEIHHQHHTYTQQTCITSIKRERISKEEVDFGQSPNAINHPQKWEDHFEESQSSEAIIIPMLLSPQLTFELLRPVYSLEPHLTHNQHHTTMILAIKEDLGFMDHNDDMETRDSPKQVDDLTLINEVCEAPMTSFHEFP